MKNKVNSKLAAIAELVFRIGEKRRRIDRYSADIMQYIDAMIDEQNELYEMEYELFEMEYLYG